MDYQGLAEKALQGFPLTKEDCYLVLRSSAQKILDLLQAAFKVRERYFGKRVILHQLINAKSGLCTEDCTYCSQSAISKALIEKYPLIGDEEILKGANLAKAASAKRYCIVTSGHVPLKEDLNCLCRIVRRIKEEINIEICTSLGSLSEEDARNLREAGVDRYNHNLNTSERFYPRICTTHSYRDRIVTLENARKAGLQLCCGALFGMGESEDDIIDLSFALRKVRPDSIPVNFLNPIPGTPMEGTNELSPLKCLSILSLIRLINPDREIRVAGGREFHLRSLQPLALYPANSIFVSGYLTTSGQTPQEAQEMITDMGFTVEREIVEEVGASLS